MKKRTAPNPFDADFLKGGAGSGNFGHSGRPGMIGGSNGGSAVADTQSVVVRTHTPTAQEFSRKFESAMSGSDYSAFVTHYKTEELAAMKALIMTDDGKAGVAVKDHGDGRVEATALFNQGGPKGTGEKLLAQAVKEHGVNYVECFGDALRQKYEKVGFAVKDKYDFDPAQAPAGWNYDKFGRPPYYTMQYAK